MSLFQPEAGQFAQGICVARHVSSPNAHDKDMQYAAK
jgi:hypothetical protein